MSDIGARILLTMRLPRAIDAAVAGAGIGLCGLLLQTLLSNPLADTYVLGIVYGARFGVAVIVVLTGVAGTGLTARLGMFGDFALVFGAAAGAGLLTLTLAVLSTRVNAVTVLLSGLMLGYFAQGLINLMLHFVDEEQARVFDVWDDGSFANISPTQLGILVAVSLACLALMYGLSKSLNALLLGRTYAQSLGVSIGQLRGASFCVIAALAGTITAFCGPIAFLGIVASHTAKGLFRTTNHRILIPGVALTGGTLAVAADFIIHLPWSRHFLHLNAVNGLIGAPIVLWILLGRTQSRRVNA